MCVCGGGVLAGVEQSCNEQILEGEIERVRERPKNKRAPMTWWNRDTATIQI